jgi:hypothetical protein
MLTFPIFLVLALCATVVIVLAWPVLWWLR